MCLCERRGNTTLSLQAHCQGLSQEQKRRRNRLLWKWEKKNKNIYLQDASISNREKSFFCVVVDLPPISCINHRNTWCVCFYYFDDCSKCLWEIRNIVCVIGGQSSNSVTPTSVGFLGMCCRWLGSTWTVGSILVPTHGKSGYPLERHWLNSLNFHCPKVTQSEPLCIPLQMCVYRLSIHLSIGTASTHAVHLQGNIQD